MMYVWGMSMLGVCCMFSMMCINMLWSSVGPKALHLNFDDD